MISKSIIKRIGVSVLSVVIIMSQPASAVVADEIIPMDEMTIEEAATNNTTDIDVAGHEITDIIEKTETTETTDIIEITDITDLGEVEGQIESEIVLGEGEDIFADAIQIGNATFGPGEKRYDRQTEINTNSISSVVEENTGADPDRRP